MCVYSTSLLAALGGQALFLILSSYCSCGQDALVILFLTVSIGGLRYFGRGYGILARVTVFCMSSSSQIAMALSGLADADGADSGDWCFLRAALNLLSAMQQLQRLAIGTDPVDAEMPEGLKARMCRAAGEDDFEGLEERLTAVKSRVHALAVEKLHLPATES